MVDIAALRDVISLFWRLRIAVAGDLTLRRTLQVSDDGLVAKEEDSVGGIGLVLSALNDLTVQLRVAVTVVGDDGVWFDLKQHFAELTFSTDYLQIDRRWTTPVDYQIYEGDVVRQWRLRHDGPLDESLSLPLQMQLRVASRQHDGLIVVDQAGEQEAGIVDDELRRVVRSIAEQEKRKRLVVWSGAPLGQYAGCWRYVEPGELANSLVEGGLEGVAAAATEHRETYFLQSDDGLIVASPGAPAALVRVKRSTEFSPHCVLAAIAAAAIAGADPLGAAQIGAAAATLSAPVTTGAIAKVIEKI
ncbi:hypothetical protein LOC68_17290 [Blastopirellula sp. JC732]|uniref:Carbohydrate kinase PfkB domain-containing protein n=1 Tax=Blastopirellula sediminis TaxID=2894196 RepID=A0A9X1MP63_9BACT|nr:hypothetical protein [Blastopirellula sediminis]MCC9606551.1 hypothetical protein [Blastopirellula sediminis]MCC9630151.1 hypothetical protein [Blastopirellula sediminis]